jgi:molecular chaperone GrpE
MRKSETTKTGKKKVEKEKRAAAEKQAGSAEQIDHLKERNRELEDRLLRLAAEFDNYKKRTAREFQQLIKTAGEGLIIQLVGVLDDFERALDSARSAKDFDSFHQGVELIYGQLEDILIREGLQPIEAVGQPFDPHQHEAMMQVDDGEHPSDTVVSQIQRGYTLGHKLLRPARVAVSRRPQGSEIVSAQEQEEEAEKEK